jgi:hypothetical protein
LFAPQRQIVELAKTMDCAFTIVDADNRDFDFDYHCPLLSLPHAFKTTLETIPVPIPYLKADTDRIEKWRSKIGTDGFKIGISWQGSTGHIDLGRSFGVSEFDGLSKIDGVRLISLQKGGALAQLDSLPAGMTVETLGDDFDEGSQAFLDTAAVMKSCDLVITSDTAVAHLAGALGIKTWVALQFVPEWRWLLERQDSPWYPTARLFRQRSRGDWKSVFQQMEAEMRSLA